MIHSNLIFNESFIVRKLLKYTDSSRIVMNHPGFVKSAIIVLLLPLDEEPYQIILIRRTKRKKDKHSGEISFPGGIFDSTKDKNYEDTALREVEEELGIPRENIKIMGCLDDHLTPKGFIITPFVGYLKKNINMIKQEDEVEEIIQIPVSFFANKENYKEKTYMIKYDKIGVGKFRYTDYKGIKYVIFGATSHIIVNFIDETYDVGLMKRGIRRIRCEDIAHRIVK